MTSTSPSVAAAILLAAAICVVAGCRTTPSVAPVVQAKATAWPRTFTDALGETATLEAPPKRIVSLSPAITEIVFAIGAGDRLVGVTEYCDYPPEATRLPTVGAYTGFSLERVLSLKPEVVIGMRGTSKEAVNGLREAGVPVLTYDPVSVGDVLDLMDDLSGMIPAEGEGTDVVEQLRARVEAVKEQATKLPRHPRVLCAVQIEPLYAAGKDNHIDDMIRLAGGENAAGDAGVAWPQYSLERMLEKDPEVIIIPRGYMGQDEPEGAMAEKLKASRSWAETTAVKRSAITEIPDDLLTLPGPRIVEGLETIARVIEKAAASGGGSTDHGASSG